MKPCHAAAALTFVLLPACTGALSVETVAVDSTTSSATRPDRRSASPSPAVEISDGEMSGQLGSVVLGRAVTGASVDSESGVQEITLLQEGPAGAGMLVLSVQDGLQDADFQPGRRAMTRPVDVLGCSGPSEGRWVFDEHASNVTVEIDDGNVPGERIFTVVGRWQGGDVVTGHFRARQYSDGPVPEVISQQLLPGMLNGILWTTEFDGLTDQPAAYALGDDVTVEFSVRNGSERAMVAVNFPGGLTAPAFRPGSVVLVGADDAVNDWAPVLRVARLADGGAREELGVPEEMKLEVVQGDDGARWYVITARWAAAAGSSRVSARFGAMP